MWSLSAQFARPVAPTARVAALQPVGLLRAADRGAAQAPPPGTLRDRGEPRGCQGTDRRPPRCPGKGLENNSVKEKLGVNSFLKIVLGPEPERGEPCEPGCVLVDVHEVSEVWKVLDVWKVGLDWLVKAQKLGQNICHLGNMLNLL